MIEITVNKYEMVNGVIICTYLKIENFVILSVVISEIVKLVNFT